MRLLHVSDLHYRLRQYDWLTDVASDGRMKLDAVAIAGDLLDIRSAVPIDAQAIAVAAALARLAEQVPVLSASGNHDLDGRDPAGEKSARWLATLTSNGLYVDGADVAFDDVLVTVCPWWDGPLGKAALEQRLVAASRRERSQWVWVHHAPPKDSPLSWDGRKEWGDETLATWVAQFSPDVVLTGHIHQAPFVPGGGWAQQVGSTWLFNPGQQSGPVPSYVLLDLAVGTAEWVSATERLAVELAPPT